MEQSPTCPIPFRAVPRRAGRPAPPRPPPGPPRPSAARPRHASRLPPPRHADRQPQPGQPPTRGPPAAQPRQVSRPLRGTPTASPSQASHPPAARRPPSPPSWPPAPVAAQPRRPQVAPTAGPPRRPRRAPPRPRLHHRGKLPAGQAESMTFGPRPAWPGTSQTWPCTRQHAAGTPVPEGGRAGRPGTWNAVPPQPGLQYPASPVRW